NFSLELMADSNRCRQCLAKRLPPTTPVRHSAARSASMRAVLPTEAVMPSLVSPFAQLDLIRQPPQPRSPLQAFDAADEYLLAQLHEEGLAAGERVLLLNDGFGALACSLA